MDSELDEWEGVEKPPLTEAQKRAQRRKNRGTSLIYGGRHFAVLESYAKMPNPNRQFSTWPVHLALVELTKENVYPTRIRQTDKAIRQIILLDYNVPSFSNQSGKPGPRVRDKAALAQTSRRSHMCKLVDLFDKLYPMHFMSKRWPLPYRLPWYRMKPELRG